MEQEIIVKVEFDSSVELAAKMDRIGAIARADAEPAPPGEPAPPVEPPKVATGIIECGSAQGLPGSTVEVIVTGSTTRRVTGFGFAIGMGHRLTVQNIEFGEFFKDLQTEVFSHPYPNGYPEPYYNVFLGFFKAPTLPVELIIPPETVLVKVRYKIPTDHTPGITQTLLNRTKWFRKDGTLTPMLNIRNMYMTEPDIAEDGIDPVLVSGKVHIR